MRGYDIRINAFHLKRDLIFLVDELQGFLHLLFETGTDTTLVDDLRQQHQQQKSNQENHAVAIIK